MIHGFVILHNPEITMKATENCAELATLTKNKKKCIKFARFFEKKCQCPLEKSTNTMYYVNMALCKKYCVQF